METIREMNQTFTIKQEVKLYSNQKERSQVKIRRTKKNPLKNTKNMNARPPVASWGP